MPHSPHTHSNPSWYQWLYFTEKETEAQGGEVYAHKVTSLLTRRGGDADSRAQAHRLPPLSSRADKNTLELMASMAVLLFLVDRCPGFILSVRIPLKTLPF